MNVQKFMDLFIHRDDVFAAQQSSGAYFPVREQLTEDWVAEHLAGLASYGVYVIQPMMWLPITVRSGPPNDDAYAKVTEIVPIPNTVKYVVFDLDTHYHGATTHLLNCIDALIGAVDPSGGFDKDLRHCTLLESSGNKGTHVWLFFDQPISAGKVRRWIERDFMPQWQETAGPNRWPLEVFPKQDGVEEGFFGNLVKLPLGKHAVTGNFSEFLPSDGWATGIEDVVPLPVALVPEVEPAAGSVRNGSRSPRGAESGPAGPFPCINHIQRDGVGQGYRDRAMFHLALYWFGHGLDQDQAEEVCVRANENFDPPLPLNEVRDKVASAYRGRYASARCGTDWLNEICPGPCRGGWSVREVDGGSLRRATEGDLIEVQVVRRTNDEGRSRVMVTHPDAENSPSFICGRGGE